MADLREMPPTRRCAIDAPDAQVRRALRRGDLVAVRRGVLVGAATLDTAGDPVSQHLLAMRVAVLSTPGPPTYVSLGSAALLHGFQRIGRTPVRVRLCRSSGARWRDQHVAVLVCGLPPEHLVEVLGVPATSPPRTVIDLARWVHFRSGVVIADSALRLGVTPEELLRVVRDCRRWPGIRKAREVVAFADGRAASALESISRVSFHEAGLPAPQLQTPLVWDAYGDPLYTVDFYWEEFRVVGEADGLVKYDERMGDDGTGSVLRAEKIRHETLEDAGYEVVRWGWTDIWRRPEWVIGRIRRAFELQRRRYGMAS